MSWNLLYILDVLAISSFAISYYLTCYRRGYRIDIWHSQLFVTCVMPNMIMLPFSRSDLNAPILGRDFQAVVAALPNVFLVALLGYFAVFAGGLSWRIRVGLGTRRFAVRLLDIVPQWSMMLMSSRSLLVFQALLCLVLQFLILSLYFAHNGFGFDLRQYTFANPALRPVALFISGYSIIIGSHCFARYIEKKERILFSCTILLTIGLVFFGSRSNILFIYINVLLCYLIQLRTKISLFRLISMISVIIVGGLYLGSVRAGQYSLGDFFELLGAALLYGNTFSDLRDFAWVDALWDHNLWIGKTYLAALTAFVPRFVSEFRDHWGTGAATAITLGLDPHVHPGVRPGAFGESYFNFGLPGVVIVGLAMGVIFRRVDIDVKRAMTAPQPSMRKAFASTMLLTVAGIFAISANSSGFFVLAGIYFFSWLCLNALRLVQPRYNSLVDAG
jgi:oligosaccharide repeat unit polymerase